MNPEFTGAVWRRSSRSGNGNNCVEVAAVWRKSSRSGNGNECVEVATGRTGVVGIRDSKDPAGPVLAVSAADWRAFLADLPRR